MLHALNSWRGIDWYRDGRVTMRPIGHSSFVLAGLRAGATDEVALEASGGTNGWKPPPHLVTGHPSLSLSQPISSLPRVSTRAPSCHLQLRGRDLPYLQLPRPLPPQGLSPRRPYPPVCDRATRRYEGPRRLVTVSRGRACC